MQSKPILLAFEQMSKNILALFDLYRKYLELI
jgi:hypothetical protein